MTDITKKPALTRAEDNPWYLLATLFGEQREYGDERQAQNRVAWNRYYASQWSLEERGVLEGRIQAGEFTPFSAVEMEEIREIFAERAGFRQINMPKPNERIVFSSCFFRAKAHFSGYVFSIVSFSDAIFSQPACIDQATFLNNANFYNTIFRSSANFHGSKFHSYAAFIKTTFKYRADFSNTYFKETACFIEAEFYEDSYFVNCEFDSPASFEKCYLVNAPPQFFGAKLHEGTIWRWVSWPRPPVDAGEAGIFTDAYERLKLEMDRLKKHEDELMFFAKELQCRRVAAGQFQGLPIGIYGVLCHYGQSYLRPFGWLLALILVGAVQFWPVLGWDFLLSLGVSTANTLGPLGLRKELIEPGTLPELSRWLRVLSGAQMVLGLILLFLIGLGLRNRFRMK